MRSLLSTLIVLAFVAAAAWGGWLAMGTLAPSAEPDDVATGVPARAPVGIAPPPAAHAAPDAGSPAEAGAPGGDELDPFAANERGIAALQARDFETALEHFERCHAADPDEPAYSGNLAETLARMAVEAFESEREDERAEALEWLARAVELAPERGALARLLDRWKRSSDAEEGFERVLTEHFELAYDLDRDEVRAEIEDVQALLEDAYLEFGEAFTHFPVEAGARRIRVVLYSRAEFDTVTGLGTWAGGVFDGMIRVPVADLGAELARVGRVLRHELLHAFVHEVGGRDVPGWLNEGLAQRLETPGTSARAADETLARSRLAGHEFFALADLAATVATWTDVAKIERAYAQSLALVAHVERQYGDAVLFEMVTARKAGTPVADTFRARIGLDLDTVLSDLAGE